MIVMSIIKSYVDKLIDQCSCTTRTREDDTEVAVVVEYDACPE
jgi:hypothetical protein